MATQQKQEVTKQELKDLIDDLPGRELHALKRYVQFLRYADDPLGRTLAEAPWDDEPVTQEDLEAIEESNRDIAAGRVISHEDLKKELGI